MLRIYIADDGIEGHTEGCGCCSSEEHATVKDIKELILGLEAQTKELKELQFLVEKYGEENLAAWRKQFVDVYEIKLRLDYAKKYEDDPSVQGTYYKTCFEKKEEDEIELDIAEAIFAMAPSRFKKYTENYLRR